MAGSMAVVALCCLIQILMFGPFAVFTIAATMALALLRLRADRD